MAVANSPASRGHAFVTKVNTCGKHHLINHPNRCTFLRAGPVVCYPFSVPMRDCIAYKKQQTVDAERGKQSHHINTMSTLLATVLATKWNCIFLDTSFGIKEVSRGEYGAGTAPLELIRR